jgi:hypothetical protein
MILKLHVDGTVPTPTPNLYWVFGSNLRGAHGKGAALVAAKQFGAQRGIAAGFSGQSYAIPTKDEKLRVLPLEAIEEFVKIFLDKARTFDNCEFFVTRIGCGLAGYRDEEIAPMFRGAPSNCSFAMEWREFLQPSTPSFDINL